MGWFIFFLLLFENNMKKEAIPFRIPLLSKIYRIGKKEL